MKVPTTIEGLIEFARRDDCLDSMVPSDLRRLLAELQESKSACKGWMEKTIELQKRIEGGRDESKQCTE